MNKGIILVAGMVLSFAAMAQDTLTRTLPDGRTQVVVPVTERQCELQDKANLGNAALGAGVGYATGEVASRALSSGRRSGGTSTGALVGAAIGALIGANTQNEQTCHYVDTITGYRVITIDKNGKSTEVIIPKKK